MSGQVLAAGARGGGLVAGGQILRLGVQLAGTVILSRLLSPADFGIIAMVFVFTSLGALLRDFGVSTVMLQEKTLTHQQASNLFWLSAALSTAVALVLAVSSPLLVLLYNEPRLSVVAPVLSLALLMDGVQSQLHMQLARNMRFAALAVTDIAAQIAALAVAIFAALAGWGYWALVSQALTGSLLLLLLRELVVRWWPALPRKGHGSKAHFRMGGEYGLAQLLTFVANNADRVVAGARWGATELGYYSRAFQLYVLPRSGLLDPLTQVAIPTMNSATADGTRHLNDLLLKLQSLLSLSLSWVYLVAATTADWLIPLVLGEQWGPSVRMFQFLCIGGVFVAFSTVSYWMFVLNKLSRQLLLLHLVTKPMAVVLIVIAAPFGVDNIALAYAAGLALAWPINLMWLARTAGQDSWAFFRSGTRVLAAAAIGFIVSRWVIAFIPDLAAILMVLIGAGTASGVYILALLVLPGGYRMLSAAGRSAQLIIKGRAT